MFRGSEGVQRQLAKSMAQAYMLLLFLKHNAGGEKEKKVLGQLKSRLQQIGRMLSQIEGGKKLVSGCFFAASVASDAQEGLANFAFQQTMSNSIGEMTRSGMSPTDPLSIISFCHQNMTVPAFNTVTLAMTDGQLRGALNGMYLALGLSAQKVEAWVRTNKTKR